MAKTKVHFLQNRIIPLIHRFVTNAKKLPFSTIIIAFICILLSLALRYSLLDFKSVDYFGALRDWYNAIKSQGFSAFGTNFSNYNPPYLYILYIIIRFFPDLPGHIAVKLPSLTADFVCAFVVLKIVKLKYDKGLLPLLAGSTILFTPTIVLNSAFWGQADSIFTSAMLACLYFLLKDKPAWTLFFFSVSLAFKLQAVFMAPFLVALLCRHILSWKHFLFIPVVLLLAIIPSWIAGRPIIELLKIYITQSSQYEQLTWNAPSIYAWLPQTKQVYYLLVVPGLIMGDTIAFLYIILIYKSPAKLSGQILMELALISVLLTPFFLPKMHERYFYPADVISIAFAFYYPQLFYIPILVEGVSFFSYQPFLFNTNPIPLQFLAAMMLVTISILVYHVTILLYSQAINEEAISTSSQ